jgi:hypothetical protein
MVRMLGFLTNSGKSLQVRYPGDPNLSSGELKAGIALAARRPTEARVLLDNTIASNPKRCKAWVPICAEQGFPELAQRYNGYVIGGLPHDCSADTFRAFIDQYCLGTYGVTFDGFNTNLERGLPLAVRKKRSELQGRQDAYCLTLAAYSLTPALVASPSVLLGYLRLLVRHPLDIEDMSAVRKFVMPVLRREIASLDASGNDSQTLQELTSGLALLRERFQELIKPADLRARYSPDWFENLEADNSLLREGRQF